MPATWQTGWLRRTGLAALGALAVIRAPDPHHVPIEALVRQSEHLAYFEAFVPARRVLEHALRAAKWRGDARLQALCLDRLGLVLDFEGQPDAGADHHSRALSLARETGDTRLAASVLASMGLAHWRQADYGPALDRLHEALRIQEEIGDAPGRARTLLFIGRVHFKKAQYTRASEPYREAVRLFTTLADRRWLSIALEDTGDLALEQGFFVDALDSFGRALDQRKDDGDPAGETYMLNVIGKVYLNQGSHREALPWFERASRLARRQENNPGLALALYHTGIARNGLEDHAGALQAYAEALALKQNLGDRRQQAWILVHMGDAHARQRALPLALDRYRSAIAIWQEIGDPRGLATGLSRAARLSFELGRYEASLDAYRSARELLNTGHPAFVAPAQSGMAMAYAALGDHARALEHGRRAVEMARGAPPDVRWAAARSLGWIERRLGNRERALAWYLEAVDVIEALRTRTLPSADVRADFLERKQAVYGEAIDVLFELGRIEQAFDVAERARTRAFLDMLRGKHPAARPTPAPSTVAEARSEATRTRSTIVEYFSAHDRLFIWVFGSAGSVHAVRMDISRRELADLTGALRRTMATDTAAASRPLLRQLHDLIIAPVNHLLPRQRDSLVTIVPHGPLFLTSFAALLDDQGSYFVERHTLVYSPSVSVLRYTHTNRVAARRADERATAGHMESTGPRMLVVGNPSMPSPADRAAPLPPLPGAEREARAIAALYPAARVRVLTGGDASERAFRELAPAYTTIHLATHAVVFDDAPMRSYLALATESSSGLPAHHVPDDGLLSVEDVFGLNLRARLVALSACDTGLGHLSGEGVVGLSRAFIYAGAASVLVSLWRLADTVATTQMELFYRESVRTGGNNAASLARAQREMIALLRGGHLEAGGVALPENPLFWAAVVLVGEAI